MKSYTFAQLFSKGFCLTELDVLLRRKMATFGKKSGTSVLTMNLDECHSFITEMNETRNRWR